MNVNRISEKLSPGIFSWICLLAELYGFEPDGVWRIAAGLSAMRHTTEVRYWWQTNNIRKFHGFQSSARIRFEEAIKRALDGEGHLVKELYQPSQFDTRSIEIRSMSLDIPLEPIRQILNFSRLGPWKWDLRPHEQEFNPLRGEPDPDSIYEFPFEIPMEDKGLGFEKELTLCREVERLGHEPASRKSLAGGVEITAEAFRNLLYTARAYGFRSPSSPWDWWASYYRLRNPSEVHFEVSIGFIRVRQFDVRESQAFATALSSADLDEFKRRDVYLNDPQISDLNFTLGTAISRVSPALASSVIALAEKGAYRWRVYRDGIVQVEAVRKA